MQWRRFILSGGAAVGAAAAYNALVQRPPTELGTPFDADEGWLEWRGRRIAHSVRGSGPPLLLLHSIGLWSWSYEWRHMVAPLAERYRVYSLDLLGFGRSDRPHAPYSARLYLALIADFVRRVIGSPVALVAAGLSGAYAVELAAADPARFPIVALIAPTGIARLRERPTVAGGATRRLVATPVVGTAAWNARVSRTALRIALQAAYHRDARVNEALLDTALATTHQPGAKYAPTAWLAHQLSMDVRPALRRLLQPGLLVWGAQADGSPPEESLGYRALKQDLGMAIIDDAGDFPHEERPAQVRSVLERFLARG